MKHIFSSSSIHSRNISSFTLVELLIVIGILAILTAAVVIVLNPMDLLRQSRDAKRLSDLASIHSAISLLLTQSPTLSLGSSSVIYTSLVDTTTTCANLGLPTLPSGITYKCSLTQASSTAVDGTGWIPLPFSSVSMGSALPILPIDPQNTTSSGLYYTYTTNGTQYELTSIVESQKYQIQAMKDGGTTDNAYEQGTNLTLTPQIFPFNWIRVPGDSTFGTSDFYVMKYEAKCAALTNPAQGLTTPTTAYNTYDNSSSNCTSANNKMITSLPSGYPIANISHDTAKTYCTSIGSHLLTNDEYMTIARNAEQQPTNWNGGVVGTSYLFSGHNDGTPFLGLPVVNSSDPYDGTGNSAPSTQRRTHVLSNGSTIWDLAGNVWEHVQRSTNNVGDLTSTITPPSCSDGVAGWGWCQYGNSTTPYVSSWTADVVRNNVGPSNASWNSSQGMGQVYTYKNGTSQGTQVFLRGGRWGNGSYAGLFTLTLDWGTGNAYYNVGFRCAR